VTTELYRTDEDSMDHSDQRKSTAFNPDAHEDLPQTEGGKKPEKVEDRPNVGTVSPEDYPRQQ
jgi:hypothetical protein